ncbi:MAG: flagellar hook-basal body complex protein, partial [Hyphomonadaceae bacterium]|nr:flagellar hook-basal body complex protein [Hyphomonadaceae bacterium]
MTILSSLNTSLTSLFTFSKSLDVISDNLANLNSAGFKANELLLRDLGNASPESFSQSYAERGQGVEVTGTIRRFTQGELRQTGTDTHLAIDGSGFFAVMTPDGIRYTRAGQFQVDAEGKFVDAVSGAVLQRLSDGNDIANLVISRTRTSPPQATKTVALSGNLS